MRVLITEYLRIDLESEKWECRRCEKSLGSARENYKKHLLVYERNPRQIHKPIVDPEKFEYTFAPDAEYCTIYEFYCPHCGVMAEVEYQVPGHMPVHDIELDIDALKMQWKDRRELKEAPTGPDTALHCGHDHDHSHGGGGPIKVVQMNLGSDGQGS